METGQHSQGQQKLDPNLEKIRDVNLKLIQKGKLALPIIHAKSYLFNILGEERREEVEKELEEFVESIRDTAKASGKTIKYPRRHR